MLSKIAIDTHYYLWHDGRPFSASSERGSFFENPKFGARKFFSKMMILPVENLVTSMVAIDCVSHAPRGTPWDTFRAE
jgi:hypothetical protein